ncbi:uncharacterized protein [Oscarella lobularis]|uniref:uncharacterized protein isoform X2 n=1 Tax=Oscarella lobularis TaxID=121494 RepID=UPI0033135320
MSTLSRHHELSLYAFLFVLSPIGSLAAQTLSPNNTNATTYGACGPPPRDVEENARCRALCFDANTPSTKCHDNCVFGQLPGSNTDPVPDTTRFTFLLSYRNRTLVLSWGNSEKDDAVERDEAATASNYSATESPTSSAMHPQSATVIYAIERTCTPTKDCHSSEKQPHGYYVNEEQRQILLPYPHFNGKAMYCAWAVSQYAVRPISSFPIEILPTNNLDVKSLNVFPFVRPHTLNQINVAVSWTCPSCNFSWATEFEVYVSRDQEGKNVWCSKPWSHHFTDVTRTPGYDSFVLASDNWNYQCSYAMTIMVKSLHRLEVIAETEAFTIPDHSCMLQCTDCPFSYEVDENLFPPNTVINDVCPDDPCYSFVPEKAVYFNTSNYAFIKLSARDGGWSVDTTFVWKFTSNETCRDVIDHYSITTRLLGLVNGVVATKVQDIHTVNSISKIIRLQPDKRYRVAFSSVTKHHKTSLAVEITFDTPPVPPSSLRPSTLLPTSSSLPPSSLIPLTPSSSSSQSSISSEWSLGLELGCGLIGIFLIILIIGVIVAKRKAFIQKLDQISRSSRSPSPEPPVPVIEGQSYV